MSESRFTMTKRIFNCNGCGKAFKENDLVYNLEFEHERLKIKVDVCKDCKERLERRVEP
jgi:hypothetical protein